MIFWSYKMKIKMCDNPKCECEDCTCNPCECE